MKVRIGENTEVKCMWVDVLDIYLKEEWPDFKPEPYRLERVRKEMESGECVVPVDLVCSHSSGKCRIQDGRHRITAAKDLGREKLLTLVEWRNVSW